MTQLLRMDEAAAALNISRSKLYVLAQRGELPGAIKIGASWRVSKERLEEWIATNSTPTPPRPSR